MHQRGLQQDRRCYSRAVERTDKKEQMACCNVTVVEKAKAGIELPTGKGNNVKVSEPRKETKESKEQ